MPDRNLIPRMTVVGAQRLAIASSVAALLMFGALVYTGAASPRERAELAPVPLPPVVVNTASADSASSDDTASATPDDESVSDDDETTKARKAVTDFIREAYPNAKVDGVFLLSLGRDSNLYFARADAAVSSGRTIIPTIVCEYKRRNGASYWRAESLSQSEAANMLRQAAAAENAQ